MSNPTAIEKWRKLAEALAALMHDGNEGAVLAHLGRCPNAAAEIVTHASSSDSYTERKLAAALAGHITAPEPGLLRRLLDIERERDRSPDAELMDRLQSQSVVEDIVFAASRWCWREPTRAEGLEALRTVVTDTLGGHYWNTASYALVGVSRYDGEHSPELLRRFHEFAHSATVDHPSRPSLTQEKQFADALVSGNTDTLGVIDGLLRDKDKSAAQVRLDPRTRAMLADLIDAAGGGPDEGPTTPSEQTPKPGFLARFLGRR